MTEARMITAVVAGDAEAEATCPSPVPWWSFTKTTLAAAALALVAQGQLDLDGPVGRWPFTLRQVLQHRAGLADYGGLAAYHDAVRTGEAPWPRERLWQQADADTLVFQPGQGWAYSNIGYLLVRELIEAATGRDIGTALESLVFAPLGIGGIKVASVPADLAGTAWGNPAGYHPGWVYHGLLIGPAASAVLLLHRLLDGALLPPALLSGMLSPHPVGGPVPGRPWQTAGYGLGLMIGVGNAGPTFVGHTGGGPGSTAAVYQQASNPRDGGPHRVAAAFAPVEAPAAVECRAMHLARR